MDFFALSQHARLRPLIYDEMKSDIKVFHVGTALQKMLPFFGAA